MPINSTNYISSAQCIADTTTASSASCTILSAATAIATGIAQDGNKKVSVPTLNDLPNIETCAIGSGHIVYVDAINVPVVSGCDGWYALDGRRARKDVFERRLWAWGGNVCGELGNSGAPFGTSSPVTTTGGGINWCLTSAGCCYSTALKTDGTLWAWGYAGYGRLGNGTTNLDRSSPVTTAGGGTNWCQVAASNVANAHTGAIKTDGTLWMWGYGLNNQLAPGNGNNINQCSPVTTAGGGTNWCQVAVGGYFTAAIKTDGTLWAWGVGNDGRLGDGSAVSRCSPVTTAGGGTTWRQTSLGHAHAGAIKTDGTLWVWGLNSISQLGTGDSNNYSSPVTTAGGGTTWCQVTNGSCLGAGIKTDGTLWVWGYSSCGQLGTGFGAGSYSSPVTTAGGGTNWRSISSSGCHTVALKTDGTLWTWGFNSSGQLGTGNTTAYCSPVSVVGGLTNWCQVSASMTHTLAIIAA